MILVVVRRKGKHSNILIHDDVTGIYSLWKNIQPLSIINFILRARPQTASRPNGEVVKDFVTTVYLCTKRRDRNEKRFSNIEDCVTSFMDDQLSHFVFLLENSSTFFFNLRTTNFDSERLFKLLLKKTSLKFHKNSLILLM